MITDIEDYFTKGCGRCPRFDTADCSASRWAEGLAALRTLCLNAGLVETVKWGHPCYMHADRNIVLFGALRNAFHLNFFNATLLDDPLGLLERQGPNSQRAEVVRFENAEQVSAREATLKAMISQAKEHAEKGVTAPKTTPEYSIPDELTAALDADPELAEAFNALTPGRQRSYCMHISAAKASATRAARVARSRDKIHAGKGFNER